MNKNKRDSMDFNDQELDSLLQDFFQKEMPEDLLNPPLALGMGASTSSARTRKRQTGLFGVFALAAAVILLISFALNQFHVADNTESTHPSVAFKDSAASSSPTPPVTILSNNLPVSPKSNLLFYSSENMSEFTDFVIENPDRYETPEGPVEQRNTFYNNTKVIHDLKTGNGLKVTVPELEIEILEVPEDFE